MSKKFYLIIGVIVVLMLVVFGYIKIKITETTVQTPIQEVDEQEIVPYSQSTPTDLTRPVVNYDTVISNEQFSYGVYVYNTEKCTYKFDQNLTDSDIIRRDYIKKIIEKNEESYYFLENFFGFKTPEKITIIFSLSQNQISKTRGNIIQNELREKITQTNINNLIYGNAHELSHIFFPYDKAPRYDQYKGGYRWLMEGLANFLEHYEKYGSFTSEWGFLCEDDGWAIGYLDTNNQKVYNSIVVPYYDFSIRNPYSSNNSYSQLSRSSAYTSGECFWIYIKENYGEDKLRSIFPIMHQKVSENPKYYFLIVREVINPVLETDLSTFVEKRYNYIEPESISSLQ